MSKLILKKFNIIDPSENLDVISDLLIEDGVISEISQTINSQNIKTIQGNSKILTPGFIDLHVHYRDPGETYKEDIKTGSLASAKGGFTTVVMMANTNPTIDNLESVISQRKNIDNYSIIRTLQMSSVTSDRKGKELVDIDLLSKNGVVSFSDDGDFIRDESILLRALKTANKNKRTVFEHCEDDDLSKDGCINSGAVAFRLGLKPRHREAEINIVKRDVGIAKNNNLWIYIQHVSCKESVSIIRQAKKEGVKVNAEVTPHHLFLNENWTFGKKGIIPEYIDLDAYDANTRVNPPLRTEEDRISLIEGLNDGTLDIIATDHAPHSIGDKLDTFESVPAGISGTETALPILLTLVKQKKISIEKIVTALSNNPGQMLDNILGLKIGKIKEGYNADFTVIDKDYNTDISEDHFISKSSNSPLIGTSLSGRVIMTIFDGKIIYGADL